MNKDDLDDLKQLVETTAANTEANLKKDLIRIEGKIDSGFAGAGDAISNLSDHINEKLDKVDEKLSDHETRISNLEAA